MQELTAKPRIIVGKKVKNLRAEGLLPAVVYGEKIPTQPITVSESDFEKVYAASGESAVIQLSIAGQPYNVLIHNIEYDPIKGKPIHADFYAVRMDKELRARVALHFTGESPAVKNLNGILIRVMQEIEIEALPQNLPPFLNVDVSPLIELGSKILVRDLQLPEGVTATAHADDVVVIIEAPRTEEELKQLEEAPTAEIAEVTTEQEAKRAEREKEGGSAEEGKKEGE